MRRYTLTIIASFVFTLAVRPAIAETNDVTRVSLSSAGEEVDGNSTSPALSSDGQIVVFSSVATDLVSGDNNGVSDIFLHNRATGETSLLSLDSGGGVSDGSSTAPSVDDDASIVAFVSSATDLVSGDNNGIADIFVLDRSSGITTRISADTSGSDADAASAAPAVSGDNGRYVAFSSAATDLISGDINSKTDIFLRDRNTNTTTRVSVDTVGSDPDNNSSSPAINGDGTVIVFASDATDIVSGDINGLRDIFAYNTSSATTTRVSVDLSGSDSDDNSRSPSVSGDGRFVAFESDATDLISGDTNGMTDIFVRDLTGGTTSRVSIGFSSSESNGNSIAPRISADGRYVLFFSDATNIVSGDTNNTAGDGSYDVFVYDRTEGDSVRVNRTVSGGEILGSASASAIDADGSVFAFAADYNELVPGDNNEVDDIFVVDEACPTDSDNDSTVDCSDACPFDSGKIAEGVCGCDVADTDSDSDGSADCNDACDTDGTKTEVGSCGCGTADADLNGNGVFDCFDPTADDKPLPPTIKIINGDKVEVKIPSGQFQSTTRFVEILQGDKRVAKKRTANSSAKFNITQGGSFTARYRFEVGDVKTKFSKKVSFRLP